MDGESWDARFSAAWWQALAEERQETIERLDSEVRWLRGRIEGMAGERVERVPVAGEMD